MHERSSDSRSDASKTVATKELQEFFRPPTNIFNRTFYRFKIKGVRRSARAALTMARDLLLKGQARPETIVRAATILRSMGYVEFACEILVSHSLFREAAELLVTLNKIEAAAKLYVKAHCWERALRCYDQLGNKPLAAKCAAQLGDYSLAAQLFVESNELGSAAKCFLLDKEYRKAAHKFGQSGDMEKAANCYRLWFRSDLNYATAILQASECEVITELLKSRLMGKEVIDLLDTNHGLQDILRSMVVDGDLARAAELFRTKIHKESAALCSWVCINREYVKPTLILLRNLGDTHGEDALREEMGLEPRSTLNPARNTAVEKFLSQAHLTLALDTSVKKSPNIAADATLVLDEGKNDAPHATFFSSNFIRVMQPQDRNALFKMGDVRDFSNGVVLLDERDQPPGTVTVISGEVTMTRYGENGEIAFQQICRPGMNVGEAWSLLKMRSGVKIEATTDVKIHVLDRNRLNAYFETQDPEVSALRNRLQSQVLSHLMMRVNPQAVSAA
jgi:tetratricopeptide (TPR) repeat protein